MILLIGFIGVICIFIYYAVSHLHDHIVNIEDYLEQAAGRKIHWHWGEDDEK